MRREIHMGTFPFDKSNLYELMFFHMYDDIAKCFDLFRD